MSERQEIACQIIAEFPEELGQLDDVRNYAYFHANAKEPWSGRYAEYELTRGTPAQLRFALRILQDAEQAWESRHQKLLVVTRRVLKGEGIPNKEIALERLTGLLRSRIEECRRLKQAPGKRALHAISS